MDPNQPSQPFDPDATTLGPPVPAPSARAMVQPPPQMPTWPNMGAAPPAVEPKKAQKVELSLILFLFGLIGLLAFAAFYILERM